MDPIKLTVGEILGEARELFSANVSLCVGSAAAIMFGFTLLDMSGASAASAIGNIAVSVFGLYHFIEAVLKVDAPAAGEGRRYLSMFGAAILSGIGTVLGFVLLILPGLYLLARWSISSPMVVAERATAAGSLAQSWEATRGSAFPIALVYLLLGVTMVVPFALIAMLPERAGLAEGSLPGSLAVNAFTALITIGGWLISLAIYRLLRSSEGELQTIFA